MCVRLDVELLHVGGEVDVGSLCRRKLDIVDLTCLLSELGPSGPLELDAGDLVPLCREKRFP